MVVSRSSSNSSIAVVVIIMVILIMIFVTVIMGTFNVSGMAATICADVDTLFLLLQRPVMALVTILSLLLLLQ